MFPSGIMLETSALWNVGAVCIGQPTCRDFIEYTWESWKQGYLRKGLCNFIILSKLRNCRYSHLNNNLQYKIYLFHCYNIKQGSVNWKGWKEIKEELCVLKKDSINTCAQHIPAPSSATWNTAPPLGRPACTIRETSANVLSGHGNFFPGLTNPFS